MLPPYLWYCLKKHLGIGKRGEARVEYRKVYFRIRSRYQFDSGWPAETDAAKFHEESRSLFQSAGWDLQPGGDSTSDTVKVTLCFAEKENPEVAVLVKQALLSAYAMPQK